MNKVRCAIYTRKSSEEGLEQDFNSLHAQREACAAYILSQASEGWSLLPDEYDDGGLSGGTLERPALQRLLADVEAGKIDIVVVYKVDRLTRSLLDFSRLVETFDKAGTSFVSVTQSFNTTTSMGRLTLNMLLSFAQFEREVTAERIRDKIAASKAKGMWMGGNPPLGYRPDGRSLATVEEHAQVIRDLFRRYREIGNVRLLKEQLDDEGVTAPERFTSTGRKMGGVPFSRGQIYRLLSNPIYIGEIHHKGSVFAGQHEAIIERPLWDEVQAQLADHRQGQQRAATVKSSSLFAGRIMDSDGNPLIATHACKGEVRYRYYVSKALQHEPGPNQPGLRIPAMELEKVICEHLAAETRKPLNLVAAAGLQPSPEQMANVVHDASQLAERLAKRDRIVVRQLVEQVRIGGDTITVEIDAAALAAALHLNGPASAPGRFSAVIAASLRRSGSGLRLVQDDGRRAGSAEPQEHLIRLFHRAQSWWEAMNREAMTIADLARKQGVTRSYASRLIRLNFLAPAIVEAIVSGTQPVSLDAKTLLNLPDLPLDWTAQRALLHLG